MVNDNVLINKPNFGGLFEFRRSFVILKHNECNRHHRQTDNRFDDKPQGGNHHVYFAKYINYSNTDYYKAKKKERFYEVEKRYN